MSGTAKRRYHAPAREESAERTRTAIVRAAKEQFEERGWSAATMRAISEYAGVSQKTAEAIFGTKAALLQRVVEFAIRGDIDPTPVNDRPPAREMEEAATAARFLRLHAAHLRRVHSGSARIAAVVEQAALSDAAAAALWEQMTHNRRAGTTWATNRLLSKPRTDHLDAEDAWRVFWLALDWRTYRTLTDDGGLDADGYEAWIAEYYRRMFARR